MKEQFLFSSTRKILMKLRIIIGRRSRYILFIGNVTNIYSSSYELSRNFEVWYYKIEGRKLYICRNNIIFYKDRNNMIGFACQNGCSAERPSSFGSKPTDTLPVDLVR
jgi:hypothetical protein